ncbi:MAG: permease [Hydrogenophilaceae bacterium]|jgi:hypothetical protein|nr:permease [Hydrogenophilaceae bacterium]
MTDPIRVYTPYTPAPAAATIALSAAILALWGGAVVFASEAGLLRLLQPLQVAALVASGIALPAAAYALSPRLRNLVAWIGLRRLTIFHAWRIPAGLAFLWYGAHGELPLTFALLAGIGDVLAGAIALWAAQGPQTRSRYWFAHSFGMVDFIVAVGTGLTFTMLQDPAMDTIRTLPMSLIPMFGVGLSGATHIMALHMLSRR